MASDVFQRAKPHVFMQALGAARREDGRVRENCMFREASVYANGKCFLTEDGRTGFAVTMQGELISLFNLGERGLGILAVSLAKEEGATHLECAARLTGYYERLGFKATNVQMSLDQ